MVIYSPELQTLLNSLYSEPGRYYHNINHIKYLLAVAKQWRTEDISANDAVYTELQHAIWWHDAVYNIFSAPMQNEIDSAALFKSMHEHFNTKFSHNTYITRDMNERIVSAIHATANHLEDIEFSDPATLTKLMLDVDLASFGDSIDLVRQNSADVLSEYLPLGKSHKELCTGRLEFLKKLKQRKRLFYTDYFHTKYEKTARENINILIADMYAAIGKTPTKPVTVTKINPTKKISKPDASAKRMVNTESGLTGWIHRIGPRLCPTEPWRLDYDDGSIWYTTNIDMIDLT